MSVIAFVFISLVVVLPIILFVAKHYHIISEMRDLLDAPFVCPNCGHHFTLKMHQVWFKLPAYYMTNGFRVKCPNCKRTDVCSHPHN